MLSVALLTLLLLAGLVVAYRYLMRPWFVAAFFGLGIGLMLLNAGRLDLQVFTWVKVITLGISMGVILWYPRSGGAARPRLAWAAVAILALNIFEAVVADAMGGQWVNALVGLSLIATLGGPARIAVGSVGGRPAMDYDLPWSWILAYTAWNITVVCAHYPLRCLDHVAVLSAPILAALAWRDRRRWLEARAFTLGIYAVGIVLVLDLAGWSWIPPGPSPVPIVPGLNALAAALAAWNGWGWLAARRAAVMTKIAA